MLTSRIDHTLIGLIAAFSCTLAPGAASGVARASTSAVVVVPILPAGPSEQAARASGQRTREDDLYDSGREALDASQWSQAVERFDALVALKGTRLDAALYWKAYALEKLGDAANALRAVAELTKGFPTSRWATDAKALELRVRQAAGQAARPEAETDEDLKLLAIQSLQNSDPSRAVPLLQQVLQGNRSAKLKERALFVLAQSQAPQARQILADTARGASNPELQRKAIEYLGVLGNRENRELLAEIYKGATDIELKRRILRAFMVAGERPRLLAAASAETDPTLRGEAVKQLGVMGAHDELWQLYDKESSTDVRRQIIEAMFVGGSEQRLIQIATTEANPDLKRAAVRTLGLMDRGRTGAALVDIFARSSDAGVKRAATDALFVQGNAEALVALARKETDPTLKKVIVSKLSVMQSKVALDYMLEILGK
ncbi:MAG: HEAT repeat domain-containing protein [Vicinamibacterales bacterium]